MKSLTSSSTVPPFSIVCGVCAGLVLLVLGVFGQTVTFDFVNFDDPQYVTENPIVTQGLTPGNVAAAFARPQLNDWVPLTALSHMAVWQVCGAWAGGHHLVNVLVHAATSVSLFLVLWRMTGSFWRGAVVAALFAVHPLRVESVAWVTERKDVLSGLFFVLTLGAWHRYTRQPTALRYAAVLLALTLGLLCKAMPITVPFLLLVLDFWPLGRTARVRFSRLVWEKVPLLVLCGAVTAVGVWLNGPAVGLAKQFPLPLRLENGVVSYAAYLGHTFWPRDLAVLYPYPVRGLDLRLVCAAAAGLVALTGAAFFFRHRQPWWWTGWLWFLGMLVPVIGLIPAGEFARADRYTYLPQIGLFVALVWTASHWAPRRLPIALAVLAVSASAALAWRQTAVWKNSESLWEHTLACTRSNPIALNQLGLWRSHQGRREEAIVLFREAIGINPSYADARYGLGNALLESGAVDEAIPHLSVAVQLKPGRAMAQGDLGVAFARQGQIGAAEAHLMEAVRLDPASASAHSNLGNVLLQQGRIDEAVTHYRRATEIDPRFAEAEHNLGSALAQKGEIDEAISHHQRAVEIQPRFAEAHNDLALALARRGRFEEAAGHYRQALEVQPAFVGAANNLAWLLATCPVDRVRNGAQAVELARRASQLAGGGNLVIQHTLAAAQAEAGRFAEAVATAESALQQASAQGHQAMVQALKSEMDSYRAGTPLRDPASR